LYLKEHGDELLAISITSQRASIIAMGESGNPLCDAFMWQDKTTNDESEKLRERISDEEVYAITGIRNDPYFSAPKIMWIKSHEPDIFNATKKFIGIQDYVAYRLTGRFVTDHSQACRTLLMDISKREWSPRMLQAVHLDVSLLPDLVPPGTIIGTLTVEAAIMTGLSVKTSVILAGGDQQTAAIGMGVIDEGTVEANTGTGAFIITHTKKPTFHPKQKTLCSAAAIPDTWVLEAGVITGGILYNWFAKEFIHSESSTPTTVDYGTLDNLVQSVPPGSNGIIALPHFKGASAPFWNPYAKGMIFNVTLANTRADMARSLLESVVLEMGLNLDIIQQLLNSKFTEVVVAGGLTKLDLYNQMQADIFRLPVKISPSTEATAKGALICAMVTLQLSANHREAYEKVNGLKTKQFEPRPQVVEIYRQTSTIRQNLYKALELGNLYHDAYEYNTYLGEHTYAN
jgi:sugar (pentulose or hexulose) kinase